MQIILLEQFVVQQQPYLAKIWSGFQSPPVCLSAAFLAAACSGKLPCKHMITRKKKHVLTHVSTALKCVHLSVYS